jgi:trehalose 6-phosphate phosphatase
MHWRDALSTSLPKLAGEPRLGLVTDVDGTLSPIVPDPDAAQVTPRNRRHLETLCSLLPLVAVISGRSVADLRARVGVPGLIYIGNHGLERWVGDRVEIAPDAASFRPALEAALQDLAAHPMPGVQVEDKGATLSIHYRRTADPPSAAADLFPLAHDIAARHGLKLYQGRMVFELRPPVDINKGSAFRRLIDEHELKAALYLGDDTTDLDAFQVARQLRQRETCYSLSVGVESEGTPDAVLETADLLASGVSDVESLLAWLVEARRASST